MLDIEYGGVAAHLNRCVMTLSDREVDELKAAVYRHGIVVLKNQTVPASAFVEFGRKLGELTPYYEEMYRHPEQVEIFVSSNCRKDGSRVGVPRTGKFWHSDYAFMDRPFALTITYPQVVSSQNRGTYFIDMAEAYDALPDGLKVDLDGAVCAHSVRRYFKIRPEDVYRPLGDVIDEVERKTPAVSHPAIITHPVTGARILYVSRGFTQSIRPVRPGVDGEALLARVLELTGQTDDSFSHPGVRLLDIEAGDIIVWDNRRYVHHARHSTVVEPTETYRVTAYDGFPFDASGTADAGETVTAAANAEAVHCA